MILSDNEKNNLINILDELKIIVKNNNVRNINMLGADNLVKKPIGLKYFKLEFDYYNSLQKE